MPKSHQRKPQTSKLGYQSLEIRQLLAGVVNVDIVTNDLFIRGDDASNQISISLDASRGAVIESNPGTQVEFSNNIKSPISINSLDNIFIRMGAGDDRLAFDMQSNRIDGSISIQLASGDDTLFLMGNPETENSVSRNLRVHCSSGSDLVFVSDITIDDNLCLTGGGGDDQQHRDDKCENDRHRREGGEAKDPADKFSDFKERRVWKVCKEKGGKTKEEAAGPDTSPKKPDQSLDPT